MKVIANRKKGQIVVSVTNVQSQADSTDYETGRALNGQADISFRA